MLITIKKIFLEIIRRVRRNQIRDFMAILGIFKLIIFRPKEIVYDLDKSPPTFGDFTYTLGLCNSLQCNSELKIILTYSEKIFENPKWNIFSKDEIFKFIEQLQDYGEFMLKNIESKNNVRLITKKNYPKKIKFFLNHNSYIDNIRIAKIIWCYRCISGLLGFKRFVFKSSENRIIDRKNYISIVIRKDDKKGKKENTSFSYLYDICKSLRLYTDLPIVIVSDHKCCELSKKYLKDFKNILFSNSYGGIKESTTILLQSDIILQKDAGGICVPYLFSDVPYYISMGYGNLVFLHRGGTNRYDRNHQNYKNIMTSNEYIKNALKNFIRQFPQFIK